ncbi:membrane protein YqaA with SNARE-associated domain [Bradyrhizobium sp. i1.7.7]
MVLHRGAMLKRIYDWCIDAAHKPYALWIMGAVAFAESSFFPVPPDVMLIPMSLARPQRAWLYAAVCTATSVVGGLLGYAIGALLFDSVGHWLIQVYGLGDKVDAFRASYAEWGAVIILLKGLTPIPYKLVTITSGFAGYNIGLSSSCARSSRAAAVSSSSRSCSTAMATGSASGSRSISVSGWRSAPPCWCSASSLRSS